MANNLPAKDFPTVLKDTVNRLLEVPQFVKSVAGLEEHIVIDSFLLKRVGVTPRGEEIVPVKERREIEPDSLLLLDGTLGIGAGKVSFFGSMFIDAKGKATVESHDVRTTFINPIDVTDDAATRAFDERTSKCVWLVCALVAAVVQSG